MTDLTPEVETVISNIPSCAVCTSIILSSGDFSFAHKRVAQAAAIEQGILNSPCGLNIACVCRDDSFIDVLQQNISKTCDFQDEDSKLVPGEKIQSQYEKCFTAFSGSSPIFELSYPSTRLQS